MFIEVTPNGDDAGGRMGDKAKSFDAFIKMFNDILQKYRELIAGIFGLLTLTLIVVFYYFCMSLGANSTNPQGRRQAIARIVICGIALALFGSLTLIFSLFWNVFK